MWTPNAEEVFQFLENEHKGIAGKPDTPIIIMNGGQTGACKSSMTERDIRFLSNQPGGVIAIDWDRMRSFLAAKILRHFILLILEKLQQNIRMY